jgi:hypothetical protein
LLGEALKDWHDFYVLMGGAAATLVGLTFVAASIGVGVLKQEHEAGLKAFITPTVVHFAAILTACLLILAPFASVLVLGAVLLAEGIVGIAYSVSVLIHIRRQEFGVTLVLVDRVWYAAAPVVAYAVFAGAAGALASGARTSLIVLACGLGLLLLAGIRNAWDMALWIMMRPRDKD